MLCTTLIDVLSATGQPAGVQEEDRQRADIHRQVSFYSCFTGRLYREENMCVVVFASVSESGSRFFKSQSGSRCALQNPVSDPQQCKKVFLKQRTFDHFSNFKYCSPSKVRIEKNTIHLKKSYIRIVIFEK